MKRYNIVSAGVGHKLEESQDGLYMKVSEVKAEVGELRIRAMTFENQNSNLIAEQARYRTYYEWHSVVDNPPAQMSLDSDLPIRIGWDGSTGIMPNVKLGYCSHVANGTIWLDCNGSDMDLSPEEQPTHWGPAMLPPGV